MQLNHSTRRFLVISFALISFASGLSTEALGEPEDPKMSAAKGWIFQQMNAITSLHQAAKGDVAAIATARAEMKCLSEEFALDLVQHEINAIRRVFADNFDPQEVDPFVSELFEVYRTQAAMEARLVFITEHDPRQVVMWEDAVMIASTTLAAASILTDRGIHHSIVPELQSGCGHPLSAFALSVEMSYRLSVEIVLDAVEAKITSQPGLLPPGIDLKIAISAIRQIRASN